MVSQVSGKDVITYEVKAACVVSLGQVLQYVTSLSVEDTHGLGKVVSLHDTALTAVQAGQHTVAGDLIRVVGPPVVQVMTHGSYHQSKCLQTCYHS